MKAYIVFSGMACDGCILVYAETASKARAKSFSVLFDWEYIDTQANRAPDFDQYYIEGREIIDCNSDLPPDAQTFYSYTNV